MFPTEVNRGTSPADKAIQATIAQGLPRLWEEMSRACIVSARQVAAFLAHLAHESGLRFDRKQVGGTTTYTGRGYIQLTGQPNYTAAGTDLMVDLLHEPELARSLDWSAAIAGWYWTIARPGCNAAAERLDFGATCRYIGYPLEDGSEDLRRAQSFADALKYLTGSVPDGIKTTR